MEICEQKGNYKDLGEKREKESCKKGKTYVRIRHYNKNTYLAVHLGMKFKH